MEDGDQSNVEHNMEDNEVNVDGEKSVEGVSVIEDNQELIENNENKTSEIKENTNTNNEGEEQEQGQGSNLSVEELEKKSVEEIISLLGLTSITAGDVVPSFAKVLFQNNTYKFYMGKNNTFGVCSLMVLNGITLRKKEFIRILKMFSSIKELDCKYLIKLKGISVISEDTCYLMFEPIMNSYNKKNKEGTKYTDVEKFALLFYVIEMTSQLHENKISIEEFRLDNVIYNSFDEFKYLIPMCK